MCSWMLYGANGYTGELIAAEAVRRGLRPILAGRRGAAIGPMASRLRCEARIFPLDDPQTIAGQLEDADTVLLAAGPFSATSAPMLEACLLTGTHYLDVTGELPVVEACYARDAEARSRGCVVMPAVGFIVVASDCLAVALKEALPDATRLEIAYGGNTSFSRGTARTMVRELPKGGAVREGGVLLRAPLASNSVQAHFRDGIQRAVAVPWGDLASAYRSTGIPNIGVYVALPN